MRVLALLFATQVGCVDPGCTDVGCIDGVSVTLRAPDGVFEAGTYEVTFVLDGVTTQCSFTLAPGELVAQDCDGSYDLVSTTQVAVFRLGLATELRYDIRHDGRALASSRVVPVYKTSQPNGARCGPTCTYAELDIQL
jgi:hypothetical protein